MSPIDSFYAKLDKATRARFKVYHEHNAIGPRRTKRFCPASLAPYQGCLRAPGHQGYHRTSYWHLGGLFCTDAWREP